MKKIIATFALVLAVLSVVSCGGQEIVLEDIEISGYKTEFVVGDSFDKGALVVNAVYTDDSTKDVTAEATVTAPATFDVAGSYVVKVAYDVFEELYQVNVAAKPVVKHGTVEAAVNAAQENANNVASGSAIVGKYDYINSYDYAFGANYTEVKSEYVDYHYEKLADDSVFGVQSSYGELTAANGPTEANLKGVDFGNVLGYAYEIFGAENLLATLYEVGHEEGAKNYVENVALCAHCNEEIAYTFSYEIYLGYYYYLIEVSFNLDVETQAMVNFEANLNGYYEEHLNYDKETATYSLPEVTPEPDFERDVIIAQALGERIAVNPYPANEVLYNSFDIVDAESNTIEDGGETEVIVGVYSYYTIANALPETAVASVNNFASVVTDSEGVETYSAFCSYDNWENSLYVVAFKAGTYTVELTAGNVAMTFTVVAGYADITSFEAAVYDNAVWDYVVATEVSAYTGAQVDVKALVNKGANPNYTVALQEANDAATLEEGYDSNYYFTATAAGTYVLVFTSAADASKTATITVTVTEAPSIADLLDGKYEYYSMMLGTITYDFTPESEGANNGNVTVAWVNSYAVESNGGNATDSVDCTYTVVDNVVTIVPVNAGETCPFGIGFNDSFELACYFNGYPQYGTVTKVEAVTTPLTGSYKATYIHPMAPMSYEMELVFNTDGTGTYSFLNEGYTGTFAFVLNEGVITFSNVVATFGNEVTLTTATYENDTVSCTVNIDGGDITLDYATSSATPTTTDTPVVGTNNVEASYWGNTYTFTAEEDGTYTIAVTADSNNPILGYDSNDPAESFTVTLEAGDFVEFVVMADTDCVVEVVITKAE